MDSAHHVIAQEKLWSKESVNYAILTVSTAQLLRVIAQVVQATGIVLHL